MGNTLWFEARAPDRDRLEPLHDKRLGPLLERWGVELDVSAGVIEYEIWDAYMEASEIERERKRYFDPSLPFLIRGAFAAHNVEITDEQAHEWWRAAYLPVRELGWQLYPDSLDVLRALKEQGLLVGVNTDRPFTCDMFSSDLEDYGLAPYVNAIVCSGDTGYYKPHRSTFDLVLRKLGVEASEAVMVGDDARDLEGAKGVGMFTVWKLNGRHDVTPRDDADYAIHDLGELLALPIISRSSRPVATAESLTPHEDGNADRY